MVSPQFGAPPAAELLRQQFKLALDGELDVFAALEKRGRDAAVHGGRQAGEPSPAVPAAAAAPPVILWHDGVDPHGAVVEIRSGDRTGLLAMLTRVFERAGVDIAWARITTFGSSVIDAFAITDPGVAGRQTLEGDLQAVLPAPPPGAPVQEAG